MDKLKVAAYASSKCWLRSQTALESSFLMFLMLDWALNIRQQICFCGGFFCHNLQNFGMRLSAHISHVRVRCSLSAPKCYIFLCFIFSFGAKFNLAVTPSSPSLHTVSMFSWRIWQWAAPGTVNTSVFNNILLERINFISLTAWWKYLADF